MKILYLAFCVLLASCAGNGSSSEYVPSRKPYEGFSWEKVSGAGITFHAQKNDNIRVLADASLPGAVIVKDSVSVPDTVIMIFDIKDGNPDGVIEVLRKERGWNDSITCEFKEVKCSRSGVKRYVMVPSGKYADITDSIMKSEPLPVTCNGWGIGNSGMRYFEIHDTRPDKAVFVEIGQDAPLFDEESIMFTDAVPSADSGATELSKDILYEKEGILTIAHEVRSFRPDGENAEYWIVDKTGILMQEYDRLTAGDKNGIPVRARLKLEYNGKWDDGFAAEYDGVFFVRQVIGLNH